MKKTILILVTAFMCSISLSMAQNVAINKDGANPNSSAMLDVSATDAGILIPRMTEAQKNAISTPAIGLMVFQTDNQVGLHFYNGSAWQTFQVSANYYLDTKTLTSTSAVSPGSGTWEIIPGLIDTITLTSPAKVIFTCTGSVECTSNDKDYMSSAEIALYKDGVQLNGGAYTRVYAPNHKESEEVYVYSTYNLLTTEILAAGTYVFDVRAVRYSTGIKTSKPRVGGAATSPRSSSMVRQIIYQ